MIRRVAVLLGLALASCGRAAADAPTMIPQQIGAQAINTVTARDGGFAGFGPAPYVTPAPTADPCVTAEQCCNAIAAMPGLGAMLHSCKQLGQATVRMTGPTRRTACESMAQAMQQAARTIGSSARGGVPAACR